MYIKFILHLYKFKMQYKKLTTLKIAIKLGTTKTMYRLEQGEFNDVMLSAPF